jgi:hypothetical protein
VIKKDVTENGKSLNKFTENVTRGTADFNMIVAQKERVKISFGKIGNRWSEKTK